MGPRQSDEIEEGNRRLRSAQDAADWIARQNVRVHELEGRVDQLREALGNLVSRIHCESMIPGGTLARWQKELGPATEALKASGWYDRHDPP
jgi:hypothetical protein